MAPIPDGEWKIVRIGCDAGCHGPAEYRLHAVCPGCGTAAILASRGTMLIAGDRSCPACGRASRLRFHPELLEPLAAGAARYRAAEETVMQKAAEGSGAARRIGNNLFFPIFSWLANGMR